MITTAVIPIAGQGTRLLPATKVVPLELMPVYDRPLIQHAVEEALASGVEKIVFVTNPDKNLVTEHFMSRAGLLEDLRREDKKREAEALADSVLPTSFFRLAHQDYPLGLGHAVLQAKPYIEPDEAFAVLLPDEVFLGMELPLETLVDFYETQLAYGHLIGVTESKRQDVERYGVCEVAASGLNGGMRLSGLVEKPSVKDAPSNLTVAGRYILDYSIFPVLERMKQDAQGKMELTHALAKDMPNQALHAVPLSVQRFDCSCRRHWIAAQAAFAEASRYNIQRLKHEGMEAGFSLNGFDLY